MIKVDVSFVLKRLKEIRLFSPAEAESGRKGTDELLMTYDRKIKQFISELEKEIQ